jgi:hypothetical protein
LPTGNRSKTTERRPKPRVAKVDQRQLQLGAPVRVPGQYYIRTGARGPVLCTWPKKRSGKKTPAQAYKEAEFALAAQYASNPDPMNLDSAVHQARGVPMVPRDFLMAGAFGTIYKFYFEDGTEWTRYRDVTINAQLVLDQVTDTPGAMLWRSPDGWVEIAPGSNGQTLIVKNNAPSFETYTPPDGGQPQPFYSAPFIIGAGTNIAVNTLSGGQCFLQAGARITHLGIYANGNAPTARVTPGIWLNVPGVSNNRIGMGPEVTGVVAGLNLLPFTMPLPITDTGMYLFGVCTRTAVWQQVNYFPIFQGWAATYAVVPPNPLAGIIGSQVNTTARPTLFNVP